MSKTFYIDSDFHCHTANPDGAYRSVETAFFDGKCDAFVNGYIYIPSDESLVCDDGTVLRGELVAPWKPYSELASAQDQYERDQEELNAAYREGVNSV